jgi:hypothetical protein
MKPAKFLHIRIPYDFHQQLVKYAEERFIPISSVVLQAVAETIKYKPSPATLRTYQAEPIPSITLDEDVVDFTEDELADLQRRASLGKAGRT